MAKSSGERQAALRERQKLIDEAEPLIKDLRQVLYDIQETGALGYKLDAMTIIGQIINSDKHGLFDISQEEFTESLSQNIGFAITDAVRFHYDVVPEIEKIRKENIATAKEKLKFLIDFECAYQEDIENLESELKTETTKSNKTNVNKEIMSSKVLLGLVKAEIIRINQALEQK